MEKSDRKFTQVSGLIMFVSAFGIILLNVFERNGMDSYIMPFVLLMAGITFFLRKPEEKSRSLQMRRTPKRILIATLSISLIAGIVVMLLSFV